MSYNIPALAKPVIATATVDGKSRKFSSLTAAERMTGVNRKKISKFLSTTPPPPPLEGYTWSWAPPSDPSPFEVETGRIRYTDINETINTRGKKRASKPSDDGFYLSSDSDSSTNYYWEDVEDDNPYAKSTFVRSRREAEEKVEVSTYGDDGGRLKTFRSKAELEKEVMVSRRGLERALKGEEDGEVKRGVRVREGSEVRIHESKSIGVPEPKGLPQSFPASFDERTLANAISAPIPTTTATTTKPPRKKHQSSNKARHHSSAPTPQHALFSNFNPSSNNNNNNNQMRAPKTSHAHVPPYDVSSLSLPPSHPLRSFHTSYKNGCSVCHVKPPDTRFLPCGHVQLCRTCFSGTAEKVSFFVCSWCKLGVSSVEAVSTIKLNFDPSTWLGDPLTTGTSIPPSQNPPTPPTPPTSSSPSQPPPETSCPDRVRSPTPSQKLTIKAPEPVQLKNNIGNVQDVVGKFGQGVGGGAVSI
ncbi:hypothetical protein TrVE_jg2297 [Triparma verrucosa]|uniref:RING-type domain-containing protein n=1 Tax=Triparma verrucosa TaxID=1606542 RepID=A0A9W7FJD9_9STRA|nr:hypothetical protein TrVE_jg2297 [Triparma verrucosa]